MIKKYLLKYFSVKPLWARNFSSIKHASVQFGFSGHLKISSQFPSFNLRKYWPLGRWEVQVKLRALFSAPEVTSRISFIRCCKKILVNCSVTVSETLCVCLCVCVYLMKMFLAKVFLILFVSQCSRFFLLSLLELSLIQDNFLLFFKSGVLESCPPHPTP